jgi:hypothetical protein
MWKAAFRLASVDWAGAFPACFFTSMKKRTLINA